MLRLPWLSGIYRAATGVALRIVFCVCIVLSIVATDRLSATPGLDRIQSDLASYATGLMQDRKTPAVQIFVFDERGNHRSLALGHADLAQTVELTDAHAFQAGALVRPMTTLATIRILKRSGQDPYATPVPNLDTLAIEGRGRDQLRFQHIYNQTSGLPPNRSGLVSPREVPEDLPAHLASYLSLVEEPGSFITEASEGFAFLGAHAAQKTGKDLASLYEREVFQPAGMRGCLEADECDDSIPVVPGSYFTARDYYPAPAAELLYPSADSLITSASDYGAFLLWLSRSELGSSMLAPAFAYDPALGGSAHGFYFMRTEQSDVLIYEISDQQPGYASYAFVDSLGRGAVFLSNTSDPFLLRRLAEYCYSAWGLRERVTLPSDDLFDHDAGMDWFHDGLYEWEGPYRPRYALPSENRALAFLSELRIDASPGSGLSLHTVFEKEVSLFMLPLSGEPGLFTVRGHGSLMDGWRVKAVRDEDGEIVRLLSDRLVYERQPLLLSAWSIIYGLGLLLALPCLGLLLYLIRRKQ